MPIQPFPVPRIWYLAAPKNSRHDQEYSPCHQKGCAAEECPIIEFGGPTNATPRNHSHMFADPEWPIRPHYRMRFVSASTVGLAIRPIFRTHQSKIRPLRIMGPSFSTSSPETIEVRSMLFSAGRVRNIASAGAEIRAAEAPSPVTIRSRRYHFRRLKWAAFRSRGRLRYLFRGPTY